MLAVVLPGKFVHAIQKSVAQHSLHGRHTWASGTPAASSVRGRGVGGGEQGGLMLPLLPQGQAPVPNADHHIFKEG